MKLRITVWKDCERHEDQDGSQVEIIENLPDDLNLILLDLIAYGKAVRMIRDACWDFDDFIYSRQTSTNGDVWKYF